VKLKLAIVARKREELLAGAIKMVDDCLVSVFSDEKRMKEWQQVRTIRRQDALSGLWSGDRLASP
jgi:hypothetical protein